MEDNLQPTASPVCRKRRQFIEDIGSLVPGQVSDDCLQRNDIWCQEINPLFTQKCSAGAPWANSTPDVIIEEIIEDNQESKWHFWVVWLTTFLFLSVPFP